jgi:hypothetical protein
MVFNADRTLYKFWYYYYYIQILVLLLLLYTNSGIIIIKRLLHDIFYINPDISPRLPYRNKNICKLNKGNSLKDLFSQFVCS